MDLNQGKASELPVELLKTWASGFHPRNFDSVGLELAQDLYEEQNLHQWF